VASDDALASMAGLLGPGADAESLVLGLINRQDRYLARRTCHARRRELGARTTTLVLSEDTEGEALLASVDLASSFPAVRTLVLRCKDSARQGWAERLAAFVSRNAAALRQLRHLDLGCGGHVTPVTSSALAAVALLPGLQSLRATADEELASPCWAALGSLEQLNSLRLHLRQGGEEGEHLRRIVDAAPQLQELWLGSEHCFGPEQLACLTGLRSLGSLTVAVAAEAAPALLSLTALQGLTHLSLSGCHSEQLLAAVGQLTGLASLALWDRGNSATPLHPLTALQQLTSLCSNCSIGEQDAQVLAGLGQLRRLAASFFSPAAATAAGIARLEECRVDAFTVMALQGGATAQAPGQLRTYSACLAGFDLSSVHMLELEVCIDDMKAAALRQQLSRCPQLRALRLEWFTRQPLQVLEALQAHEALPQLQHLCLCARSFDPQPDCGRLAVLARCSRQLRQLTLEGMADLPESTLVAPMVGLPQLQLLRLLGCSAALNQERCQALVGRLQLYEVQVDVVVDNGSGRAWWMIRELLDRRSAA
jgi:hypothetical protein